MIFLLAASGVVFAPGVVFSGRDPAGEIRAFYVPNFSKWRDHDQYQDVFKRLLQDLKAKHEARSLSRFIASSGRLKGIVSFRSL